MISHPARRSPCVCVGLMWGAFGSVRGTALGRRRRGAPMRQSVLVFSISLDGFIEGPRPSDVQVPVRLVETSAVQGPAAAPLALRVHPVRHPGAVPARALREAGQRETRVWAGAPGPGVRPQRGVRRSQHCLGGIGSGALAQRAGGPGRNRRPLGAPLPRPGRNRRRPPRRYPTGTGLYLPFGLPRSARRNSRR